MPADHRQRGPPAGFGQTHRAILRVIDQPLLASLRIDSDAVLADTPIRSARILVLTFCGVPSGDHSWAFQMTLRVVLADRGETASLVVSTHNRKV